MSRFLTLIYHIDNHRKKIEWLLPTQQKSFIEKSRFTP